MSGSLDKWSLAEYVAVDAAFCRLGSRNLFQERVFLHPQSWFFAGFVLRHDIPIRCQFEQRETADQQNRILCALHSVLRLYEQYKIRSLATETTKDGQKQWVAAKRQESHHTWLLLCPYPVLSNRWMISQKLQIFQRWWKGQRAMANHGQSHAIIIITWWPITQGVFFLIEPFV